MATLTANCIFYPFPPPCSKVVLAYEPVWAIGTGKVATAEQVRWKVQTRQVG